jgi:lipoate-protein ligase B
LDLKQNGKDVHRYLRLLEDVVIATLAAWDIAATRRDGLTGVWAGTDKIASIGIGVRRWVTFHGFALNVNTDLSYFSAIVPCGLPGVRMTSMQQLLNEALPLDTVQSTMVRSFARIFGHQEIVWNTSVQASVLKPPPTERLATVP